jgi:hypothetical protein
MNKVNTIVFCKDDYNTEQDWMNAVRDATFLLLNAQYQMVIKYDEPGLGIIRLDFESSDESFGAPWPYWLTPTEAESVVTDEERETADSEDDTDSAICATPVAETVFDEFWRDIILNDDGTVNLEAVKNELADFKFIIDQVPEVYSAVTGGVLSKPMYKASVVIDTFYENYGNLAEQARLLPDDWDLITEECKTNADYRRAVMEYLNCGD